MALQGRELGARAAKRLLSRKTRPRCFLVALTRCSLCVARALLSRHASARKGPCLHQIRHAREPRLELPAGLPGRFGVDRPHLAELALGPGQLRGGGARFAFGGSEVSGAAICPRLPEHLQCFERIPRLHSDRDTRRKPFRHVIAEKTQSLAQRAAKIPQETAMRTPGSASAKAFAAGTVSPRRYSATAERPRCHGLPLWL